MSGTRFIDVSDCVYFFPDCRDQLKLSFAAPPRFCRNSFQASVCFSHRCALDLA